MELGRRVIAINFASLRYIGPSRIFTLLFFSNERKLSIKEQNCDVGKLFEFHEFPEPRGDL